MMVLLFLYAAFVVYANPGYGATTVDLSLFQVSEGLSYAFPRAMAKFAAGSSSRRSTSCRWNPITWSSRCRLQSPTSPWPTPLSSMTC